MTENVENTNTLLEEFLHQPIPPELWHYTTMSGLEGILSSGTIWATEVHYTNDVLEFTHARDIAIELIDGLPAYDSHQLRAKRLAREKLLHDFGQGRLSSGNRAIYIASFSASQDSMSQWGWYGDKGRGVSIGFNLVETRPPSNLQSATTVAPCAYTEEEKRKLIGSVIQNFWTAASRLSRRVEDPSWISDRIKDFRLTNLACWKPTTTQEAREHVQSIVARELGYAATKYLFDVVRMANHCKHSAFMQEDEWRVALPVQEDVLKGMLKFRGDKGTIPYIKTTLFQSRFPITRVVTGPLCSDITGVERLLDKYEYKVPVEPSAIPLRDPNLI